MSTISTKDGPQIYFKDWGPRKAQPIVFHHGWPLSSDDWDAQMMYFVGHGFRVIAHDRRGHGRSSQVSDGHDMDHYAADVAAVVEHLDLRNAVHIGHSTGGGEATRYVACARRMPTWSIRTFSPYQGLSQHGAPPERGARVNLDQLCVNTIRTLAMDGVQQANSGHPGTPMVMAPVAYALWQRVLRFDPEDPIWPNRDRFVLSMGHASMLAVRAAAPRRRQGGRSGLRAARRAVGHARRHQAFPPARQQVPGASGIPLDLGHRDHHGTPGPGCGHQRGHG